MPINSLYHTWFERIGQLWPFLRITQQRNLAWLLAGICQARSVQLNDIAEQIPGPAKLVSQTRRLSRFLDNRAIRVRKLYAPLAKTLLAAAAKNGEVRLIVDATKVGFGHQLLMVALAYRKRALPIAWTWVRGAIGHSTSLKQLALLKDVQALLPKHARVLLVGDCEFGAIAVLRQLDRWHWRYVLRQPASHLIDLTLHNNWQRFGDVLEQPGESVWLGRGFLTHEHVYPVNLLAHWKKGEEDPWLLATNLATRREALRAYRRRPWIEEMFGDMKKHGFDLESTHLRHFLRLSRLTLAVALLYLWLVAYGASGIKNGQRHLVDRKDRRDLCIFQIGWRLVKRRLVNLRPISMRLCPNVW
jgi:hypothetical protein